MFWLPVLASLSPLFLNQPAEVTEVTGATQAKLLGGPVAPDLNVSATSSANTVADRGAPLPLAEANADTAAVRDQPLEVTADRQEFDLLRRLFSAIGNVFLRFRQAELSADRVQTDLEAQILVAEGNVTITRGDQVLRGDRLEYNLRLDQGLIINASGVVNAARVSQDLDIRRTAAPLQRTSVPGFSASGGTLPQAEATDALERLRFEADRLQFDGRRWYATNLRVTNDPFSPPELEVRAQEATAEPINPKETLLTLRRGRVVFDQRLALPIVLRQFVVGRPYEILPLEFGYDEQDRGGVFLIRRYTPINTRNTTLTLLPSIYLQRILRNDFALTRANSYGAAVELSHRFSPQTRIGGYGFLATLDPRDWPSTSRATVQLQHQINSQNFLNVAAIYRQRVFNGSLGEQELKASFGGTFTSPGLPLGHGLTFSYLLGGQYVTAVSDLASLPPEPSLGRLQVGANLNWVIPLWQGTPLPATQTEGLRYTPRPVQPFLQFYANIGGVANYYTNGSTQPALITGAGLRGQFGHFSRNWLDYTSFDLGFTQTFNDQSSPYLFDRIVDFSVVNVGLLQQLYGPVRAGAQMQINVDTGTVSNTNIVMEYSRRTYGVVVRYNIDRQIAAILFRINGFNWQGNADPFSRPVLSRAEDGLIRPD